MIRQWAEIMGDNNPAYLDKDWAAKSIRGSTISPPAMMYVWGQEGFQVTKGRAPNAMSNLVSVFDKHGYTGVLGTNVKQEYFKEVSPGDNVTIEMIIDNISERKTTGRGTGYFFETLSTFTDQSGETIGTQRFKVLKFIPQEQPAAAASEDKLDVPTRIASPRGYDNKWWWEACDDGKVLIQRCKAARPCAIRPGPCAVSANPWNGIQSNPRWTVNFLAIQNPHPRSRLPVSVGLCCYQISRGHELGIKRHRL